VLTTRKHDAIQLKHNDKIRIICRPVPHIRDTREAGLSDDVSFVGLASFNFRYREEKSMYIMPVYATNLYLLCTHMPQSSCGASHIRASSPVL
jgi:hypothetical protein